MNKKIIALIIVGIFLLTGSVSVSAANTKSVDAVDDSEPMAMEEGIGYLQVTAWMYGIPLLAPEGLTIEVKDEEGQIMTPKSFQNGAAIYDPIPHGRYFVKTTATKFKDLNTKVDVYKEAVPDDPDTFHYVRIKYKIQHMPRTAPEINPLLQILQQILVRLLTA